VWRGSASAALIRNGSRKHVLWHADGLSDNFHVCKYGRRVSINVIFDPIFQDKMRELRSIFCAVRIVL